MNVLDWRLAAMAVVASAVSGCMMPDRYVQFSAIQAPATEEAKRSINTTTGASFKLGKDLPVQNMSLKYHPIIKSGDVFEYDTFGLMRDSKGNPIQTFRGALPISHAGDFISLIPVGKKLYAVQQFDSRPAMMYFMELQQNPTSGELSVKRFQPLNLAVVHGGWSLGSGVVTSWNSHLGSETFEPDARQFNPITGYLDERFHEMAAYYAGEAVDLNPYDYGYPIEVLITDEAGSHWVAKHYAMGRVSNKLTYIMPDGKTAYISDQGQGGGLFLFVADKPGYLDAGTLYAMKWNQKSAENGGEANLNWVSLGHATDKEIKAYLNQQITFTDIFYTAELDKNNKCPANFGLIATMNGRECLRIRKGMAKAASRLETRRFAALTGASTELNEAGGISYDAGRNELFLAVANIDSTMLDNHMSELGSSNQIKLKEKNNCGAIYKIKLGKSTTFSSDYIAVSVEPLLLGKMNLNDANKCDVESIANPDNLTFIRALDNLIISEDSHGNHENNVVWSYSLSQNKLTRIQTMPSGADMSSPYWYSNINGYAYLTGVVMHSNAAGASNADAANKTAAEDLRSISGYVGPFPDMTPKPLH